MSDMADRWKEKYYDKVGELNQTEARLKVVHCASGFEHEVRVESMMAAIWHLRDAAQEVLARKPSDYCSEKPDCHCCYCHLQHALACTSGFAEKKGAEQE